MKKIEIVKMETDEADYEKAEIEIGAQNINGIEHIIFSCPKCRTKFGVPVDLLKTFLIYKNRKRELYE